MDVVAVVALPSLCHGCGHCIRIKGMAWQVTGGVANELLGSLMGCVLVFVLFLFLIMSWTWSLLQPCPCCVMVVVTTLGLRVRVVSDRGAVGLVDGWVEDALALLLSPCCGHCPLNSSLSPFCHCHCTCIDVIEVLLIVLGHQ